MTGQGEVLRADTRRIVVLVSGRGSNLIALHAALSGQEAKVGATGVCARITAVVANRECAALAWAREQQIATCLLDETRLSDRADFDAQLGEVVASFIPDLVVMAGFMRIVSARFLLPFEGRILNIHPSLLPAFRGLHTHRKALGAGVLLHGATVHWVTSEIDAGPILGQAVVAVGKDDDEHALAARVLRMEHRLLPLVVSRVLEHLPPAGAWPARTEAIPAQAPCWPQISPRILLVEDALAMHCRPPP
jgi:phosphoribosylglycinamide formyltransferase-1